VVTVTDIDLSIDQSATLLREQLCAPVGERANEKCGYALPNHGDSKSGLLGTPLQYFGIFGSTFSAQAVIPPVRL